MAKRGAFVATFNYQLGSPITASPSPATAYRALDATAWPRDGRQRARTLEFGADGVVPRADFRKRRLDTSIGTLNVIGLFSGR